jgi:hypothetical protein
MRRLVNPNIALTLNTANSTTVIDSSALSLTGYLQNIYLTLPALDAAATATLNVKDGSGNILYTKAAIAGGATTPCSPTSQVPVINPIFEVVTSAAQTSNKNITVSRYIDVLS